MTSRREFIKRGSILSVATLTLNSNLNANAPSNASIIIENYQLGKVYSPLQAIQINSNMTGNILVYDGNSNVYFTSKNTNQATVTIGAALGTHTIVLENKKGEKLGQFIFSVDTKTEIVDYSGTFKELNDVIHWTMVGRAPQMDGGGGLAAPFLIDGKFYYLFVPWLRDHVHTLKGMKYYFADIKPAIELFAKYQRADGMIADNVYYSSPDLTMWDKRFAPGGFIWRTSDSKFEFKRIPVEADMEYLFIEGLHATWQATGDTAWMSSLLDNALKAVKYCTSDPYRWSTKYGLVKRGYTIDTWDFQSEYHIADTGKDIMVIDKDKTKFGIMFGDNTGLIASLQFLAKMLNAVNRNEEAKNAIILATDLQTKLNSLSWNGNFFTHHVPEDTTYKPDFGVDTDTQISLSNAYSLNRGISHDKAVKIIESYKKINLQKPKSAPAEWFAIYPPFQKGFGDDIWSYMNGGVLPIVAGELAKGAFENGFEDYGVDILLRVLKLAKQNNNYIYGCYRGMMPQKPVNQSVTTIDLKNFVNVDFSGVGSKSVPGWTGEGNNDLHEMQLGMQTYYDIPFKVIDPQTNGRKSCIGISNKINYLKTISIPINTTAKSIYFLHTKAGRGDGMAGKVTIVYSDNTTHTENIDDSRVSGWWMPKNEENFKVAWKGKNEVSPTIGVGVCGIDNPNSLKTVKEIKLTSGSDKEVMWMILALSISDAPVYLEPNPLSTGIPDKWGGAALMYALTEGLVGLKDTSSAFQSIVLSPRWAATKEDFVKCTLKYEASGGYCTYIYKKEAQKLNLQVSTSATHMVMRFLMPTGQKISKLLINTKDTIFKEEKIEKSNYVVFEVKDATIANFAIELLLNG